ncbi:DedA family protein [Yoonia sp. 208BN28-4]|uniref:DedA family protein n=1 Tax=Yoonia sp. 208BN28-4 TaxID=3126505 RepID=UPI0030A79944
MSETILALVADYGVGIVFTVTFLSCLALPVPSSLLMLASGGFAATGDLSLTAVFGAAFGGAILGDNSGYWIARGLGDRFHAWLDRAPKRAALLARTKAFMARWGGSSVFFSCWLVAPLGPYVNYVSGLSRLRWIRFALWGIAGEIVWVSLYVGLGYSFADSITEVASVLGNASGLICAALGTVVLGWWLWRLSSRKMRETDTLTQ